MAKNSAYAIQSFKMQAVVAGAFPDTWTDREASGTEGQSGYKPAVKVYSMTAIVKDSFTYNDSEAGENDIEIEDSELPYASLPSSIATRGFTIQTYDLSADTYKYLMGYVEDTEAQTGTIWYKESPNWQLANQAVRLVTKKLGEDIPSLTFEWANMKCKVTRSGTIGKSGFPNLNLVFKQEVVFDSSKKEIAGARWKATTKAEYEAVGGTW